MRLISNILTLAFIVFWMAFVFLDYWQKHPAYFHSFRLFDYWGLSVALLLLGAGIVWSMLKFGKDKTRRRWFNGTSAFLLFMLTGVLSVAFAYEKLIGNADFDFAKAIHVIGLTGGTALAVFLIVVVSYALGSLLNERLKISVKAEDAPVLHIASGVMGLALLLFLLGAVSLLHWFVVFPLFAAVLFFGRKQALFFLKTTLWQPLATDRQLNAVGAGSFYGLVCLFAINFMTVNVPMPAGFDSLTLYANLPSLIGQHHALVEGFQPYNWSLLMSLGYVLFDSTEVSLALSWLGGTLAAWAMFVLCRSWLKMNVNWSLLAVLAFSLTPSVTIQASAELKVDLGLLFIYLSILLAALNYFSKILSEKSAAESRPAEVESAAAIEEMKAADARPLAAGKGNTAASRKKQAAERRFAEKKTQEIKPVAAPAAGDAWRDVLWMGLLSGFALGIKLTTLYFAFALGGAFWFARTGRRGFFAAFLLCLFLVFFLKIDEFAGLRQYHLGVGNLQWGILLAACFLAAGTWLQDKIEFQKSLRATALYSAFFILPFLPWVVKNYAETRSFSPDKLLNGKQASPEIHLEMLEKSGK